MKLGPASGVAQLAVTTFRTQNGPTPLFTSRGGAFICQGLKPRRKGDEYSQKAANEKPLSPKEPPAFLS